MGFAENDEVWQAYLASFRRSLKDLGWVEDRNIRFDYRFAGDSPERTRAAAEELVALAPDLIFVSTNPALSAAMEATRIIPIVFTWVSDSVGSGYVASLAHPGGNVTGFHNFEPAFGGKWLEVLKEVAPKRAPGRGPPRAGNIRQSRAPPRNRNGVQGAGNNGHPRCRAQRRRCRASSLPVRTRTRRWAHCDAEPAHWH